MTARPQRLRVRVNRYLRLCFAQQTPPLVSDLARQCCVSRNTVARRFREEENIALAKYLKQKQIERAMRLLRVTDLPVATIARRAAFIYPRSFDRAFRRETGSTPAAYRRAVKTISA